MLCHLAAHTGDNGTELGVPDYNITQTKYSYIKNDNRKRYAGDIPPFRVKNELTILFFHVL